MSVLGNPQSFPITADQPRDPLNWYGRTKAISERSITQFADSEFPAHLFLISNLYGEHVVDGSVVSKPTVINFFVDRALAGESLTVYEPGTQARNFVHVVDVARAYVHSAERLVEQLQNGVTGIETYEIAGEEDMSVMTVAEIVREVTEEKLGTEIDVELVKNPRSAEAMVEEFAVDTSRAAETLDWATTKSIKGSIKQLFDRNNQ
jgi:UDP-glucose 4-epimerase